MKKTSRLHVSLVTGCIIAVATEHLAAAGFLNGSFETTTFSSWIATDIEQPFEEQAVVFANSSTAFEGFLGDSRVIPSHGIFAASTGFDGEGPGAISLAQDVGVILEGDELHFDYRAGWDLLSFSQEEGLDRFFEVNVEPAGGGETLLTELILTAANRSQTNGPNSDTGPMIASIDLSSLAGTDARVSFVWTVPESFTGPANGQLDNVRIENVPEPGVMIHFWMSVLGVSMMRWRSRLRLSTRFCPALSTV